MRKIPIAKISKGSETIGVFYSDYYTDDDDINDAPSSVPLYEVEGSEALKEEFLEYARRNEESPSGHYPYAWSAAGSISYRFAAETGYQYKDMFPKDLQDEIDSKFNAGGMTY
ncbi:hypothetical protein FACS189443_6540 [Planctomycetales bacterium]|nr:hypothetical protein FACS189443_6540 [Planctomycetales bacterium]